MMEGVPEIYSSAKKPALPCRLLEYIRLSVRELCADHSLRKRYHESAGRHSKQSAVNQNRPWGALVFGSPTLSDYKAPGYRSVATHSHISALRAVHR